MISQSSLFTTIEIEIELAIFLLKIDGNRSYIKKPELSQESSQHYQLQTKVQEPHLLQPLNSLEAVTCCHFCLRAGSATDDRCF